VKRAVGLALLLAACTGSGEPSADNIRTALTQAGNRGGAKAEKLACASSPERAGYACDYRAPACNRFTGTCGAAKPFTGRFLYAGGRWQLVEDLTPKAPADPATQPLPGVALATPTPTPTVPAAPAPVAPPAAVPAPSAPPPAPEPELSRKELRQIARWRAADTACRQDGPDSDACYDRDDLGARLERRGLCYGPPGAFGYDRAWRPCGR
jgi:hypothetical protein